MFFFGWKLRFPGRGIGRLMKTIWVETRGDLFFPEILVVGQQKIGEAQCWHKGSAEGLNLISVSRNAGIGRVQLLDIRVRWSLGSILWMLHQRLLQSSWDQPQLIPRHMKENVNASREAVSVGSGNELTIGDEPKSMALGNDEFRVGSSKIMSQPNHSRTAFGSLGNLSFGVLLS